MPGEQLQQSKASYVLVVLCLMFAMLLAGCGMSAEGNEPLTEFYITRTGDPKGALPETVLVGSTVSVDLGIVNREADTATYTVEVWAVDGENDAAREFLLKTGHELDAGLGVQRTVTWVVPALGLGARQRVEFLLFRGDTAEVYRELHLWFDVENG